MGGVLAACGGPRPLVAGTPGPTVPTTVGPREYVCQTTPYAVQRTPRELVMYSPNVELLWPGALLQGRSYRLGDDVNALLALTIAERTPIKVSIPALKTADNFREVVPDLATVNQAIGAMVGSATQADLRTPSSLEFSMEAYHSEEQLALALGISGRYLGFQAKASFSYEANAEETTVVVHFMEKMYEVVVAPPQTPRAFFSPAFTQAKLDEQVALGRIGLDNLPIYVSNVVYGRMFTFAMTSSQSETDIRAALQAAYSFGAGSVSTDLTAAQRSLIQNSRISLATVGGDPESALSVIRSGDWRAYFGTRPPLSTAVPLSYTFRTLSDGTIALVTETTTYGRTVCDPALAAGFLPVQQVVLSLTPPFTLATGDLNGDGRTDLVWNHRGATNEVQVGFAGADGTFDVSAPYATIPGSPTGGWTLFALRVADMSDDGSDDLVWNRIDAGRSQTYVARSRGDGTFDAPQLHERTEALVWVPPMTVRPAQVQARSTSPAPSDLLWSRLTATENVVVASLWGGVAPVDLTPQALAAPAGGWAPYAPYGALAVDVTGDGADDLVFGARGQVCSAVNDGAGAFTVEPAVSSGMDCRYECPAEDGFLVGDVNGDGRADVVRYDLSYHSVHSCDFWLFGCWSWTDAWSGATQALVSNGSGGFAGASTQGGWAPMAVAPHLRDVSGDGRADLVWITLGGTTAKVSVALAEAPGGDFSGFVGGTDRSPLTALPPGATSWNAFTAVFADVNGDHRTDIVLNDSSAVGSIYVCIR